jgi:hypothetical protein
MCGKTDIRFFARSRPFICVGRHDHVRHEQMDLARVSLGQTDGYLLGGLEVTKTAA